MSGNYGYHLSLRVDQVEHQGNLNEESLVSAFLADLVTALGFRVIAGPLATSVATPEEHTGVSAVVILYESHAAIHTYANLRSAFVDVFACREFAVDTALEVMRKFFGTHRIREQHYAPRGHDWSRDARHELERWRATRATERAHPAGTAPPATSPDRGGGVSEDV